MTHVLIMSHDVVDRQMAGPGIRYWQLARVLAREFQVTLAVPDHTSLRGDGFDLRTYPTGQPRILAAEAEQADVVLAYGYAVRQWPFLAQISSRWIADVYVPEPTEALGWHAGAALFQREQHLHGVRQALEPLAQTADFYICGNERQRDFWLGLLAAYGRLTPQAFTTDPTLRSLVDTVPFGLPSEPAEHRRAVLKGVWPGIEADDQVVLWGGGLWDWLDPLTLLRAMAQVVQQYPKARLVFPGTRHPNVDRVPDMSMRRRTTDLARELGLTEKHVLFGEWVPYGDWTDYLLEADVGVSLHFESVETRFAHRTRLMDYIWAGLPMVASEGDVLGNLIRDHHLGFVVQCQNEQQVASALASLLADVDFRTRRQSAFATMQQELTWERVAEPLIRFCRQPYKAPEKGVGVDFRPGRKLHELEAKVEAQEAELAGLRDLVQRYEAGRFMRLMAACAQAKASLWERKAEEGSGIQENDRSAN